MDFSTIPRALDSISRRQPPLPDPVLNIATRLADGKDILQGLTALLLRTASSADERWEPLAVGLYVATEIVQHHHDDDGDDVAKQEELAATGSSRHTSSAVVVPVYMDGPRVPSTTAEATTTAVDSAGAAAATLGDSLTPDEVVALCRVMHEASLQHLEHPEPRVRTLVAKAVGAYCRHRRDLAEAATEIQAKLVQSIADHIQAGRDEAGNYSRTSVGAVDDTTGWRALETNWLCLASMVSAMNDQYAVTFPMTPQLYQDCEFSCVTHVNRHVRAAGMQTLEQWVRAVTVASTMTTTTTATTTTEVAAEQRRLLTDPSSPLRTTVIAVVKAGLADNWSQVRMAASVLCRVWFVSLQTIGADVTEKTMMSALLPRMCLNRFYLAQGVKLYSHETWKLLFPNGKGLTLVGENLPAVCRYYVKMCDADNHVVREGACQAIAELAYRLGDDENYHDILESHMGMLLQALLMCFFDESWPVRDEAALACGILCKAYPEACKPEFKTLWERWTGQLTDQIWSVREDAAVALGDALEAYGEEVLDQLRSLIKTILPAARDQPSMSAAEYKAHVNDAEQHTDTQLYSCGSLAPKLRKGGAGRIGCTNCGIDRPKAPWEVRFWS